MSEQSDRMIAVWTRNGVFIGILGMLLTLWVMTLSANTERIHISDHVDTIDAAIKRHDSDITEMKKDSAEIKNGLSEIKGLVKGIDTRLRK